MELILHFSHLLPYAFIGALFLACGVAILALISSKKMHLRLKEYEIALATAQATLDNAHHQSDEYDAMRRSHDLLIADKARALAEKDELGKQVDELRRERDIAIKSRERADFLKNEAERKMQLTEQKMQDVELRMIDWERQKEESVQAARAAILKAGGEMSNKLLEDHKREMEEAKKHSEERVRKTTEQLMTQFDMIAKTVYSLRDSTLHTREQMELVMRSLSNPAGVGQMAEIGLENSLKNIGLVKGRDFIIQYHVNQEEGRNVRPDAVIFLPQDTVMVIDCKASKSLLELAKASDEDTKKIAITALKKTMNEHVRALAGKDYRAAVLQSFRDSGKSDKVGHIFNVMYLPSESAIEQVRDADAEFDAKLQKHNIILAGPSSLAGLFSLAKMNIAAAHQAENEKIIVHLVSELMESVINSLAHVERVGKGIKSAAESYDAFSKSINARLLPRMRSLKELGVSPARNKDIPAPLPSYDIRRIEQTLVVQPDAHEEELLDDEVLVASPSLALKHAI
ncbi:MAG: DNA recombination protein RmuC [Alphaproteobacteria bacterium]|nr:MAG: DNA recombination protein RmuC [Alphaproteobacteria bacterium]